jgi:hypothetical protein
VQLNANYTWSHSIDNLSTTFSDNAAFNLGILNPFDPSIDKGNSDFDVRHRAVISAIWQVGGQDFFQNRGWLSQVLGGWSVAPIFEVRSGMPFSVYDCTAGGVACPYAAPTVPVPRNSDRSVPVEGTPNLFSYITIPSWTPYSNPVVSAAASVDAGEPLESGSEWGPYPANMLGRNSFSGPGAWNMNLGVYKNVKLTETTQVQFRGEAFNLFNHANMYVIPVSADVSTATASANAVVNTQRGLSAASIRDRRNVQLAIKLLF